MEKYKTLLAKGDLKGAMYEFIAHIEALHLLGAITPKEYEDWVSSFRRILTTEIKKKKKI